MYKLILLTILTAILFSKEPLTDTPKPYAALGDVIYNNANNIGTLQNILGYDIFINDIQKYIIEVNATKLEGFKLQNSKSNVDKKAYLNKLRELSKTNDFYIRSIKINYVSSMKKNNYEQFLQIINNELIDVNASKKEIIDYYYLHQEDINASGVIENFLNEDAKLKALKDAQRKRYKSKKTLQEEKIERIRATDRDEKDKIEKKLQKDLVQKKLEIRENQKKELAN